MTRRRIRTNEAILLLLIFAFICVVMSFGCGGNPPPQPPNPPDPPTPSKYQFSIVVGQNGMTGAYIEGATVEVGQTQLTTNAFGFAETELAPATYTVRISKDGYHLSEFSITLDRHLHRDVKLTRSVRLRRGVVHAAGSAFADDDGPFLGVGASLFWGVWGMQHDRARTIANLDYLATGGVNAVRVFGEIGGWPWDDREVNPWAPGWEEAVTGFIDAAFDRGMRTELVLCIPAFSTSQQQRLVLMDRYVELLAGREHKILFVEMANEAPWAGYPHPQGTADLREMYRRFKAGRPNILGAVTSPGFDPNSYGDEAHRRAYDPDLPADYQWAFGARAHYRGLGADVGTVHLDRDRSQRGWRPVRQPWEYPFWVHNEQVMPTLGANDEPIGPESSVQPEEDPLRIVMHAIVSYISKMGTYTYHTDAGIWGGGHAARTGKGDVWQHSASDAVLRSFNKMIDVLPADLPQWDKKNWHWNGHPFQGSLEGKYDMNPGLIFDYATTRGNRFVEAVGGVIGEVHITARRNVEFDIYDPLTWEVIEHHRLDAGQSYRAPREAYVIIGTLR